MGNDIGLNNSDIEAARGRLIRGNTYRDLSTVCIVATRGVIPARVVQSWLGLATPMNQKFLRLFIEKCEVGDAYNTGVEAVLGNPELAKFKYLLTLEEDNCPQADALLKLYESIQQFDVVGGLYWVKGAPGNDIYSQPMIYGDPNVMPRNYVPQLPIPNAVQPACGLGMGFTLFKMEVFRKVPKPWFRTVQDYVPGQGMRAMTQDLFFFEEASKQGFRFASDNRALVGHWDQANGIMW